MRPASLRQGEDELSKFSLEQQIEEVELELKYRKQVFGRAKPRDRSQNEYRMARMEGVLETLRFIREHKAEFVRLVQAKKTDPPKGGSGE